MDSMRRFWLIGLAALLGSAQLGCEAMKPYQLWKWNRLPASSNVDPFFSVPDPVPVQSPPALPLTAAPASADE
jgi:hypothetical protein